MDSFHADEIKLSIQLGYKSLIGLWNVVFAKILNQLSFWRFELFTFLGQPLFCDLLSSCRNNLRRGFNGSNGNILCILFRRLRTWILLVLHLSLFFFWDIQCRTFLKIWFSLFVGGLLFWFFGNYAVIMILYVSKQVWIFKSDVFSIKKMTHKLFAFNAI